MMRMKIEPIELSSKQAAMDVLAEVKQIIADYGNFTINDLYSAAGIFIPVSTNNVRYGWVSTDGFRLIPSGENILLESPQAQLLV